MAEAVIQQTQVNPAPANPAATVPVIDDKVSSKLAVIVQREKRAVEAESRARQQAAELENQRASLTEREKKIQEFERLKETNPLEALKLLGLSYQDLTGITLNDGVVPPEVQVKKVEEKLDKFLKSTEDEKQQRLTEAKLAEERKEAQAVQDFKGEIKSFLSENPQKYEFTLFEGQEELIYDAIDEHYTRTIDPTTGQGKILTIQEAADKVETYLEQKDSDRRKLGKLQNKVPSLAQQMVARQQQTFNPVPTQQKTLTNNLSATPAAPRARPRTDDDRIRDAIAYAKNLPGRA